MLINIMADLVISEIVTAVNESKCFPVIVDSIQDVAEKKLWQF